MSWNQVAWGNQSSRTTMMQWIFALVAVQPSTGPLSPVGSYMLHLREASASASPTRAAHARYSAGSASDSDSIWRGVVARDETLELRTDKGSIHVERTAGDTVEVIANVRRRASDKPSGAQIVMRRFDGRTVICGLPRPEWSEQPGECPVGALSWRIPGRRDAEVDLTARVPAHVTLVVLAAAGNIDVCGALSDIEAHTLGGDISIVAGGHVVATTIAGNVRVQLADSGWRDSVFVRTRAGQITLLLPDSTKRDVIAVTRFGRIRSDIPLDKESRFTGARAHAEGSGRLRIESLAGSIRLLVVHGGGRSGQVGHGSHFWPLSPSPKEPCPCQNAGREAMTSDAAGVSCTDLVSVRHLCAVPYPRPLLEEPCAIQSSSW